MTDRTPEEQKQIEELGAWSLNALRSPNALQLFRDRGATCEHGMLCETCLAEVRTHVASLAAGAGVAEG